MKNLILISGLLLASCGQQPVQYVSQPPVIVQQQPMSGAYHEVRIDPNTGQQVVYVQQADGTNYFLDYLIFNQLFNSGGYGSVYGYYNTHTTYVRSYSTHYSNYQPSSRYYGKQQDRSFQPSAPSLRNNGSAAATRVGTSPPNNVPRSAPSAPSANRSAPSAPSAYRPSAPSTPTRSAPSAPSSYRSTPSAPSYHSSSSSSSSGRRR